MGSENFTWWIALRGSWFQTSGELSENGRINFFKNGLVLWHGGLGPKLGPIWGVAKLSIAIHAEPEGFW